MFINKIQERYCFKCHKILPIKLFKIITSHFKYTTKCIKCG